ncbi:MAG: (2Fe-2S)-binding protein [Planctomycetes bacterium]|nr:(2Fe-2S)-binding protein [Planctomycetota bacterium]
MEPRLCHCFGFTPAELQKLALERGIATPAELTAAVQAGGGCGTCAPDLERLLEELWKDRKPVLRPLTPDLIVRDAIRPFLGRGAFELEFVDVDQASVRIRAVARPDACAEAAETLRVFVEKRLKEMYRPDAAVTFV